MSINPYKSPEPPTVSRDSDDSSMRSKELLSVMLWSNFGLVLAWLLFSGLDWLYVNWGGRGVHEVSIAWSKLLFILFGANVIIFFAYINRQSENGRTIDRVDE